MAIDSIFINEDHQPEDLINLHSLGAAYVCGIARNFNIVPVKRNVGLNKGE